MSIAQEVREAIEKDAQKTAKEKGITLRLYVSAKGEIALYGDPKNPGKVPEDEVYCLAIFHPTGQIS